MESVLVKTPHNANTRTVQKGLMMLEIALVLALISLFLSPLIQLQHTVRASQKEEQFNHNVRRVEQAVQGFIMLHGRLPCPATEQSLFEARENEQCQIHSGALPLATLGLSPDTPGNWQLVIAHFEHAGEPAAHQLVKDNVFENISLQAFTEIVLQAETPNNGLEESALPAIHLCLLEPSKSIPTREQRGCSEHPLHSPTAVAIFYPEKHVSATNQGRSHQFFIEPQARHGELNWISFEQFIWLRTMSGHSI